MTFAQKFLRIYDRKIASGEITFSRSGIDKNDFTRMCVDPEYVISEDAFAIVVEKMHLDEEDIKELKELAGY